MNPILSIILNWNDVNSTEKCINSLTNQNEISVDILLIDNGSTVDSTIFLKNKFKNIFTIREDQNHGVACGRNIGINYALKNGYEYVLLFDNDAYADKNMVYNLFKASNSNPDADIFGPKILVHDSSNTIWRAGCTSWKWTYLHSGFAITKRLFYLFGKPLPHFLDTERGAFQKDNGQYDFESNIDFQIGCAQLIRTRLFNRIGLLDEDYSPYGSEDIDFCARAVRAGRKIYYVPNAVCWHRTAKVMDITDNRNYNNAKNILLLARKNLSPAYFIFLFLPDYILFTLPLIILESIYNKNTKKILSILKAIKWNLSDCMKRGVFLDYKK